MPAFTASAAAAQLNHITAVVRPDAKTGRLVRTIVVAPIEVSDAVRPQLATPQAPDLDELIDRIAGEQGVESPLVHSVIRAESNYNAHAVSPKGAQGIMQLIPATARRFGVSNTFDARENIQGGVRYLRFLLDYYRGDYAKTIAAYNAGENAVDKYNGIPPYAETRNYVYQVARNLKSARQKRTAATKRGQEVEMADNRQPAETVKPIEASIGSDGRVYYRTP